MTRMMRTSETKIRAFFRLLVLLVLCSCWNQDEEQRPTKHANNAKENSQIPPPRSGILGSGGNLPLFVRILPKTAQRLS